MRESANLHRASINPVTLVIATLLLAVAALAATASAVAAGEIPRTESGHPDLSGTYDVATLTPLMRPAKYGDKLTLTEEEAAAIAAYWKEKLEADYQASDPDRDAPPVGGVETLAPEFSGAAGGTGGYNAFYVDIGESTFKIDGKYRTSIIIDPPNGRMPKLTPEGMKRIAANRVFRRKNTGEAWWLDLEVGPYDDPELRPLGERCLLGFGSTSGPPMLPVMYNNLKRIVQTEDYVMILVEMNHDARVIRLDAEHDPPEIRKWLGDSIGWWEGDTLVVDTTNFREETGFSMASKDLHVVERFTRVDESTLLYKFTIDDPSTWEKTWTGEYPWPASDHQVYEYACHEGNYSLGGILRGARLLEAEATKAGAPKPDSRD